MKKMTVLFAFATIYFFSLGQDCNKPQTIYDHLKFNPDESPLIHQNISSKCPPGDDWGIQRRGVANMMFVKKEGSNSNVSSCSGTLVRNTCNDGKLYFLTANHCLRGASENGEKMDALDPNNREAPHFVFIWGYEATGCMESTESYEPIYTCGARLVANNDTSDFALFELYDSEFFHGKIDPLTGEAFIPYFAGWDVTGNKYIGGAWIGHPNSEPMKVGTFSAPLINVYEEFGSILDTENDRERRHAYYVQETDTYIYGLSTPGGGASGGPAMNREGNLIGQVWGFGAYDFDIIARAKCNNLDGPPAYPKKSCPAFFGRLDYSWDTDSRPERQLKYWLDPCNTGQKVLQGGFLTNDGSIGGTMFKKVVASPVGNESMNSFYAAVEDFDNDGDDDIYVATGLPSNNNLESTNLYFQNNCDKTFSRINGIKEGLASDPGGAECVITADIDGDNDLDIYVARSSETVSNQLYVNLGDGSFRRSIDPSSELMGLSQEAVFADFNGNGNLELLIINKDQDHFFYAYDNTSGFFNARVSGVEEMLKDFSDEDRAVAVGDLNNDGKPDVVITGGETRVYMNASTTAQYAFQKMNSDLIKSEIFEGLAYKVDLVDYDNDNDLDMFVARSQGQKNLLYRNDGSVMMDVTFTKVLSGAIVNDRNDSEGGGAWGDIDNDGDLDLFVANLHTNDLYLNNGDGSFRKSEYDFAVQDGKRESKRATLFDYDKDGDLDLYVLNYFGTPAANNSLFQNVSPRKHWLEVSCVASGNNMSGLGAKVRVGYLVSGIWNWSSYQYISTQGGSRNLKAHFGLGTNSNTISKVEVIWPTGNISSVINVSPDQRIRIVEGIAGYSAMEDCQPTFNIDSDDPNYLSHVISGNTLLDNDNDCDQVTDILPNRFLSVTDEINPNRSYYVYSDASGKYQAIVQDDQSQYTLTSVVSSNDNYNSKSCLPLINDSYTGVVTGGDEKNFYFTMKDASCKDLEINMMPFYPSPYQAPCPNNKLSYCFSIMNNGKPVRSAQITILFDEAVNINEYNIDENGNHFKIDSREGNKLIGTIDYIPSGASSQFCIQNVKIRGSISPGYVVRNKVDVTWLCNNERQMMGPLEYAEQASCSYDPNDISLLSPKACMPEGAVMKGEELVYQVRFQNIGSGPAYDVEILNQLDPSFDLATFRILASSHDITHMQVSQDNMLSILFKDIILPYKSIDDELSNGYVIYAIKPKQNVLDKTKIQNSAEIYFDRNDAVKTNILHHLVVDEIDQSTVNFTYVNLGCEGVQFRMTENNKTELYGIHDKVGSSNGNGSGCTIDPNGLVWDFGDGTVVRGTTTPAHLYTSADYKEYEVSLGYFDCCGNFRTVRKKVTVGSPRMARLSASPDKSFYCEGEQILFEIHGLETSKYSLGEDAIVDYHWSVESAGGDFSTQIIGANDQPNALIEVLPEVYGTDLLSVVVTNACGQERKLSHLIEVRRCCDSGESGVLYAMEKTTMGYDHLKVPLNDLNQVNTDDYCGVDAINVVQDLKKGSSTTDDMGDYYFVSNGEIYKFGIEHCQLRALIRTLTTVIDLQELEFDAERQSLWTLGYDQHHDIYSLLEWKLKEWTASFGEELILVQKIDLNNQKPIIGSSSLDSKNGFYYYSIGSVESEDMTSGNRMSHIVVEVDLNKGIYRLIKVNDRHVSDAMVEINSNLMFGLGEMEYHDGYLYGILNHYVEERSSLINPGSETIHDNEFVGKPLGLQSPFQTIYRKDLVKLNPANGFFSTIIEGVLTDQISSSTFDHIAGIYYITISQGSKIMEIDVASGIAVERVGGVSITKPSRSFVELEFVSCGERKLESIQPEITIDEVAQKNVVVYPNPAGDGHYNVTVLDSHLQTTSVYRLQVLNVFGQIIVDKVCNEERTEIDISMFAKGVYYLRMDDGREVQVKRIISR
ncbi:MAG: T9SS type A sorting domain-containing protein [Bacteroidetes bacterium]|nr:MAG: T9SS type A sorting domain-containing protein [Bacteroidota bacterium]